MEENEMIEEYTDVMPEENEDVELDPTEENEDAELDPTQVDLSSDDTVTYIDIGTASISVNDLSEDTAEPVEITEPAFDFNFIAYVGKGGVDTGVFAAMCWNLALLYFAFDIIKWCDVKFSKIFRGIGRDD